jgi:hypothetical protein
MKNRSLCREAKLASHFYRKENGALRVLLCFLDSGSAQNYERGWAHQKQSLQQRPNIHFAEKNQKW